jgi:hypothetical protein
MDCVVLGGSCTRKALVADKTSVSPEVTVCCPPGVAIAVSEVCTAAKESCVTIVWDEMMMD